MLSSLGLLYLLITKQCWQRIVTLLCKQSNSENNEKLEKMCDLDQALPNIAEQDVWYPDKVCKGSHISPDMM